MSVKKLKLSTFAKDVAASGTSEPLSATNLKTIDILIIAKEGNTGNIYIGDINVTVSNAAPLAPGKTLALAPPIGGEIREYSYDLSELYIDADNNGDGVHVKYIILTNV